MTPPNRGAQAIGQQQNHLRRRARKALGPEHVQKYLHPLTWYEPHERGDIILNPQYHVEDPGKGYVHPVTRLDVAERLLLLPERIRAQLSTALQHVEMLTMTKKMKREPHYGMQWGSTVYLYPIEAEYEEYFGRPPRPAELQGIKRYGARWLQHNQNLWICKWTRKTLADFYLENVLMHELGHLLDKRNTSPIDRERFAEAFAQQYGHTLDHFESRKKPHRDRKNRRHRK